MSRMFQWPVVGVGLFLMATSSTTGVPMASGLASAGGTAGGEDHAGRVEPDAGGAVGRGYGGVVGHEIGVGAVARERGAVGQPEVRLLQPRDGAEGVVVHDHPDDAEGVLDRGGEERRVLAEAAVADQR